MQRTEYIWIKHQLQHLRDSLPAINSEVGSILQNLDAYLEHRFEQHRDS